MKILGDEINETNLNKKIVVFYFPFKVISGGPIYLTNLAIHLSEVEDFLVYYIEYIDGIGRNYLDGTGVKVIDYADQYEFKLFPNYEITLITPIYWGNRVPILNRKSKIVFFNWHNLCIPSLKDALRCNNKILEELLRELSHNKAVFYCDKAHWAAQEKYGVHFDELYVPITIPERDKILEGDVIARKVINFAVLGRLVIDKIYAIIDLIENIINTISLENLELNLYIIGDGNCRNMLDSYLTLKHINIFLMGTLEISQINDFLVKKIDLLFAMGTSVLEGAVAAIPSVVIPNDVVEFNCNRYTYLYECKDYLLGWAPNQIDEFKIPTHTIKEIFDDIFSGKKREIGSLCRKYYLENHINNIDRFRFAIKTSTLTYGNYRFLIDNVECKTKRWINNLIRKIVMKNPNKNIVIWGAGDGGKKLLRTLNEIDIRVSFFVDKNADVIGNIEGIEVKNVNVLDIEHDVVLISLMSFVEEIKVDLIRNGFTENENFLYVYFVNADD